MRSDLRAYSLLLGLLILKEPFVVEQFITVNSSIINRSLYKEKAIMNCATKIELC